MNPQEDKISEILQKLPRIAAPMNFDAMVMQKIEERRIRPQKAAIAHQWKLWLKFAFPAAVLSVLAFFLFLPSLPDIPLVPPVESPAQLTVAEADRESTGGIQPRSDVGNAISTRNSSLNIPAGQKTPGGNLRPLDKRNSLNGGGSLDSAIYPAQTPSMPPGLQIRPLASDHINTSNTSRRVSFREILTMLGISAECNADFCDVLSVAKGSISASAGLISGDRITAIDSRPVRENLPVGVVTVKTLTIIRDGKTLVLQLKMP